MNYPFVQAKWYSPGAIIEVRALVLHFAEGGNTVHYFQNPTRGGKPEDVSAHFVLQYAGTIVQMVRDEDADHCQHADPGSWSYPGDLTRANGLAVLGSEVMDNPDHTRVNRYVHAIEIEGFRDKGMNAAQAAALPKWVAERKATFPTIRGVIGHGDIQNKACPGKLIHWDELGGHGKQEEPVLRPGDDFNYGWESWTLDNDHTVYCIGGPRLPDGTTDSTMRLCAAGPGSTVLTVVDRARLTNGKPVTGSAGLYAAITAGAVTADCGDAVAAEHERTRKAAIAAVEGIA